MESNITTDSGNAAAVDGDGGGSLPSQEELPPQLAFYISDQHSEPDSGNISQCTLTKNDSNRDNEASSSSSSEITSQSSSLKTPSKNQKHSSSKYIKNIPKRLFRTPTKSGINRSFAVKQQKSDVSKEDQKVKRKKPQESKTKCDEDVLSDLGAVDNNDLNDNLEEKANLVKMTAKNVKSVIHHLLRDEHVLSMFRDAMEPERTETSPRKKDSTPEKLDRMPKLTRAKVREFLEKICMPSPVKAAKDGPSILDLEFNEEEDDDDEYNPETDDECHESDDESITSSKLSDFGSPYRDLTASLIGSSKGDDDQPPSAVTKESVLDTPTDSFTLFARAKDSNNLDTAALTESLEEENADGVDTIALRTRSKLPLTSTSITELESAFVAPDITADMYDNNCNDPDWNQFLMSLYKPTDDTVADDDASVNDPDFNYIAEAERIQPDKEDFRFDKLAQIPKKELSALLSELNELFEDEVLPHQVVATASEVIEYDNMQFEDQYLQPSLGSESLQFEVQDMQSSSCATFTNFKVPQAPPLHARTQSGSSDPSGTSQQMNLENRLVQGSIVTADQLALIEDNMRKHIQLLAQSFLLFQGSSSKVQDLTEPKSLIMELNYLRQASLAGENSVYNVYNLNPAIELVSDPLLCQSIEAERSDETVWKPGADPRMQFHTMKSAMYNSPAFVYPHLLPSLRKVKENKKKYSKFTHSEDNLIAIGMEQFQTCRDVSPSELLYKLLIRGKNVDQIHFRIQFMCSRKVGDNPIKCVKKTGKLPENFPKPTVDHFYPRAPRYQISELLPTWCSSMKDSRVKTSLNQDGRPVGSSSNFVSLETSAEQALQESEDQIMHQDSQGNISISREIHNKDLQGTGPFSVPQMPPTETLHGSQTMPLPRNLPTVMGLYIQFVQPPSQSAVTTLPQDSHMAKLPVFALKPQNSRRGTKRKAPSSASTMTSRKKPTSSHSDVNLDHSAVNNAGTQTDECASPDLLARTMQSCGIEESPVCPSFPSPSPYSISGKNQMDLSFTTSTPVVQEKHPTVRNLRWEFDAAQKHSVCYTQTVETSDTSNSQSHSTLSTVPQPQETSVTVELAQDFPPVSNTKQMQGPAMHIKNATAEQVFVTNSPSLSDPMRGIHTQILPSASDQAVSHDLLSQTAGSHDTTLSLNLEIVTADKGTPSQSTADCRNSSKYEVTENILLSHEIQSQRHFPDYGAPQSHTNVPASEVVHASASEPVFYNTNHKESCETSETKQNQTPIQPFIQSLIQQASKHSDHSSGADLEVDGTTSVLSDVAKESPSFESRTFTNMSVSFENIIDRTDFEIQRKPKTVGQILDVPKEKKDEHDKLLSRNSYSVVEHDKALSMTKSSIPATDAGLATSDILNVRSSESCTSQHTNSSQTEAGKASLNEQQNDKSVVFIPLGFDSTTSPAKTVAVIAIESPVKSNGSHSLASPFKTPTKHRPLIAKSPSPASSNSFPYVPLSKVSKKRKEFNKQVQQILPKSFIFEVKSPSPTKAAAQVLKKKATLFCQSRSPAKLLPKLPQSVSPTVPRPRPLSTPTRMFTRSQKRKLKNTGKKTVEEEAPDLVVDEKPSDKGKERTECEVNEVDDAGLSQEEEEEEEFEDENQSQLEDLMAACTTIRYDPKKGNNAVDSDNKSKAQKRKDICLSMLDPDILDRDPKKDERDTAYAQEYFTRVKQMLSDDPDRFKKFLTVLHELNKNHFNPVELYVDMATLLSDHQDLVDDFAGFLLSFQAVECQCFVSHLEYEQILTFLRRLEIFCDTSNLTFQRTLKMMSRWLTLSHDAQTDNTPFKDRIASVLRHVPSIMDDLMSYFFDTPLPDSHAADFEDVNLTGDVPNEMDEFEEIILPEGREDYNTKSCSCLCHQDQQDEKLRRRIKHCFSCSLKMFDGKPVLKTSRNEYQPISVLYPLEEKEKMMKAKREAAQLALAKARAQRQQNKKKNKQESVQKLKSKGSKKKLKRRRKCKSVDSSVDVGDCSKIHKGPVNESVCVEQATDTISRVTEEPVLKNTDFKLGDEHHETGERKLVEASAGAVGSVTPSEIGTCGENRTTQTPQTTTANVVTDIVVGSGVQQSANVLASSALQCTLEPESVHKRKDTPTKISIKIVDSEPGTDLSLNKAAPPILSPVKSPPMTTHSGVLVPAPLLSLGNTAIVSYQLVSDDSQPRTNAILKQQQPLIQTPQSDCSLSQLPAPALHTVQISAGLTVSQTKNQQIPVVLSSQTSTGIPPQLSVHKPSHHQPRFATSPVVSTRIPVIVTLSPQQYLSSPTSFPKAQTQGFRQQNPQKLTATTSVLSTKQTTELLSKNCESQKRQQNISLHHAPSDSECKLQNLSVTSAKKLSLLSTKEDTNNQLSPVVESCSSVKPTSCHAGSIVSSSSFIALSDVPSTFTVSCISTHTATATSETRPLTTATDIQPLKTTSHLPSTPLKEKIQGSAVLAYLDNFSLGGFDVSLGPSQLHQLNHSVSPSKLLTDSMSKFDLLALLESSNLSCIDPALQSTPVTSASSITSEPLLTFSGALAKIKSTSDEPTLASSSSSVPASQEDSTKDRKEALPASSSTAKELGLDYSSECDETAPDFVKETDSELLNDLYQQLQPSNVLQEDDASNVFELSVWTEEQDRAILYCVTDEGISGAAVEKLQSVIPQKSAAEITARAKLLLQMLENMGDTESDTGTEASYDGQGEQDV